MPLEARPYGPESTADERAAIVARVSVLEDRILLMHEIPVQTPFSVNLMFDRFDELSRDWERFAYVIDLTDARRPSAEARAVLRARAIPLSSRVAHVGAVVGNNLLMRAMVRLVAYAMGLPSVGIHATREEAIEEVRRALGR